ALDEKAEEADDRPPGRYDRGAPPTAAPDVLAGGARRPQGRTGRRPRVPPAERSADGPDVVPTPLTSTLPAQKTPATAGPPGTGLAAARRDVVVVRVSGVLEDRDPPVADGDVVEGVTIDSPDGLAVLRHSAAHVLAQAVQQVNPDAKLGIGPPITDGFYYDFDVDTPFTPEDLKALDKAMSRIVKEG